MRELAFTKMSGAGNDFVVADARVGIGAALVHGNVQAFVREVCHRQFGIGADGVLLVQAPDRGSDADFRMRYFNADGGEAEMCGNGARCITRFAVEAGLGTDSCVRFTTAAGPYSGQVLGGVVRVNMRPPTAIRDAVVTHVGDHAFTGTALNTGVPHYVVWRDDVESDDVVPWGRALRFDAAFAPAGANINFVQRCGDRLRVRTYERGVENETLACGTGLTASALAAAIRWDLPSPVVLRAQSGLDLRVYFAREGSTFREVQLEGEARVVFAGRYPVADAWLAPADPAAVPASG